MAKVTISGLSEIKKELKQLGEKKARNIMISALRAGASEISKRAKANVPKDTRDLERSIGVNRRRTPPNFIKFSVSPRVNQQVTSKGQKRRVNESNYAVNLEYGTRFQPAQPFMRNTFDQLGQNVADAISKKLAQRIEKEANQ